MKKYVNKFNVLGKEVYVKDSEVRECVNHPRVPVRYHTTDSVSSFIGSIMLNGFRFKGIQLGKSDKIVTINDRVVTSIKKDSRYNASYNSWYGNFLIYKDGVIKTACSPFVQVNAVVNNSIEVSTDCYTNFVTDTNLDFTDAEGIEILNTKTGMIHKIISASGNTITLDTGEGIEQGSRLLPAPELDDYVYLNSFFVDTAEIFNIYDDGYNVRMYWGITQPQEITDHMRLNDSGIVSPLASGSIFAVSLTSTNTGKGNLYLEIGSDGSHHIDGFTWQKREAQQEAFNSQNLYVPYFRQYETNIFLAGAGHEYLTSVLKVVHHGYTEL